ncbi:DedA family protein [Asanoa sp. NPDC050611]|uniref:DedA family protein n=1 Tax=Asanoa sp. NPDC050611 TaxID=3157098 RepID=UPI0033DB8977
MADVLGAATSPVSAYLLLLGLLVLDAFVPVIPTQAIMITGGALTAYGHLSLPTTIAVGAAGVILGDWACYLLGRSTHHRTGLIARLRQRCGIQTDGVAKSAQQPSGRARRAARKLTRGLREPGPVVILICRFVPGGRMAACFSAGRARYPYKQFLLYQALAAVGWAAYGALVGHLGGAALTSSGWRLIVVAVIAAVLFAGAGWGLALWKPAALRGAGPTEPAPLDATPVRAASADAPPQ